MPVKSIEQVVLEIVGRLKGSHLTLNSRLFTEAGLDSLDVATVVVQCEEQLNVSISESAIDWRQVETLGDLARLFQEAMP